MSAPADVSDPAPTDVVGATVPSRRPGREATPGEAPGGVLLICQAYGTPGHTGSFRWRSLTRLLGERGWRFDVIAFEAGPDATTGTGGDGAERAGGAPAVRVHAVSPSWWLWRWRRRRRDAWLERERGLSEDAGKGAGAASIEGADDADRGRAPAPSAGLSTGVRRLLERAGPLVAAAADAVDAAVWTRRARRRARALLARHGHDLVIATSPGPETHDVAADLARATGIPFVAEFRDPRYFGRGEEVVRLDALTRWLSRRAELASLAEATAIVDIAAGASRASAAELEAAAPAVAAVPRTVIPSGYEPAPVTAVDPERFRIVYTGWLWPFMPLTEFLRAAGRFVRDLDARTDGAGRSVSVELVGVERCFGGVPLVDLARSAGLEGRFSFAARLEREVAARRQQRAAVLVSFDSVSPGGICIPSKLYHYALCHGAMLPIGKPDGAMAEEARKIGVRTVAPEDEGGIVAFLHGAHGRWSRGELTRPNDAAGTLDFVHRAGEMEALFERVGRDRDGLVGSLGAGRTAGR